MITPLTFAAPFIVLTAVMEKPVTMGEVLAVIGAFAFFGIATWIGLTWLLNKLLDSNFWR